MVYFISGHRKISDEEFAEHYIPKLDKGMEEEAIFLVGDYYGVDHMAQKYLIGKGYPDHFVRVFHMLKEPRCCESSFTIGGFKSDEDRDAAMTFASHEDIAWVRKGKETSGTAQNLLRRQKDHLMVDIADKQYKVLKNCGNSEKYFQFFERMHRHLDTEWAKMSGEFVEE